MSEREKRVTLADSSFGRLVRPGDKMLVAITFPSDLDESEACHPEILLEDFLEHPLDPLWQVELHSVLPRE